MAIFKPDTCGLKLWGREALADAAMWAAGWGVGKLVAPAIMLWEKKDIYSHILRGSLLQIRSVSTHGAFLKQGIGLYIINISLYMSFTYC